MVDDPQQQKTRNTTKTLRHIKELLRDSVDTQNCVLGYKSTSGSMSTSRIYRLFRKTLNAFSLKEMSC